MNECQVCSSVIAVSGIDGIYVVCGTRTCVRCMRKCDSCLRIVCMESIRRVVRFPKDFMQTLDLCDRCR